MIRGTGKTTRMLHRALGCEAKYIVVVAETVDRALHLARTAKDLAPYLRVDDRLVLEDAANGRTIRFVSKQNAHLYDGGPAPRAEVFSETE